MKTRSFAHSSERRLVISNKSVIYQMVLVSAVLIGNKGTQSKESKISHHDLFLPKNGPAGSNH